MRVLIGLCKVDQYPVPLWCANTGAGFFAILSERFQDSVSSNRSKSSHFGSFQIRCGLARRMMGKAKSHAIYAAVRHFAKNQTEKLSQYLQVDGYFNAELERKVRIFTLCMVADCPHRICGQNGIPKFPQIGAELPAKSGNAKGRKSLRKIIKDSFSGENMLSFSV